MKESVYMQWISPRPIMTCKLCFMLVRSHLIHMWWEEFKKRLTKAFTTYLKKEGRVVHSEDMKLRTIQDQGRFLEAY
eukprot:scaffold298303_cov39-Attheya_sp.AAC.1